VAAPERICAGSGFARNDKDCRFAAVASGAFSRHRQSAGRNQNHRGYCGGTEPNPTTNGRSEKRTTGIDQIIYDPAKISYEQLLDITGSKSIQRSPTAIHRYRSKLSAAIFLWQ